MPNTENAPHWAHFQFSAGGEERSDAQHKKHGQCRPGFSCWVKGTPKNKKHAHMGVFLVFGGCKLSSDAPNTRDATRCHVSGVRYMGEWYWLRGRKIGSEQERRAECARLSCPAGGGVVVFRGCELSSDAPNTRDATRCRVSGVRYMGEL